MILAVRALYGLLMRISIPLLLVMVLVAASAIAPTWSWATAARKLHAAEKKIDAVGDELANAKAGLALCQLNSDRLTATLETQNDAVDALKAESDARTARANAAIARAREQARELQARISRLEKATPTADVCSSAKSLILETLGAER